MCSKGSGSPPVPNQASTQFQSATSPSTFMVPIYHDFINQATSLAQTPFNPAMQGSVAPMSAEQLQGGQQMFEQGLDLGNFDPAKVHEIESPYTQDVVQATQDWFNNQNEIQAGDLMSQAIRSGNAFGGDRAGIAEARLAGQQQLAQAPVIAGLRQAGYGQALDEYNKLKQFGMAGAQAATGWGQQLQVQKQRELDVAQQNAMMASAYPFQQMNWLGSILGGVGPLTGSFTQGYNTPPSPDPLATGLGIAGALGSIGTELFKTPGTGGFERGGVVRGLARGGPAIGRYESGGYAARGYDDEPPEDDRITYRPPPPPPPRRNDDDYADLLSRGAVNIKTSSGVPIAQMPSVNQRSATPTAGSAAADAIKSWAPTIAGLAKFALVKHGGEVPHYADAGDVPPMSAADLAEMEDIGAFREGARGSPAGPPVQEGGNYLARSRERFQRDLEDSPRLRRAFDVNTTAEVGENQQARDAYQATVLDRAAARREDLPFTLAGGVGPNQRDKYYPPSTLNATRGSGIGVNPALFEGANPARYGTGNASGTVMFAGGPQTASAQTGSGKERFGIEGPDVAFARRAGYEGPGRAAGQPPPEGTDAADGQPPRDRPYSMADVRRGPQSRPGGQNQGPGLQREKNFAERLAGNPLWQLSTGLLQNRSPYFGQALGNAMGQMNQQQQAGYKHEVLDQKPQLIKMGNGNYGWAFPNGNIIPTDFKHGDAPHTTTMESTKPGPFGTTTTTKENIRWDPETGTYKKIQVEGGPDVTRPQQPPAAPETSGQSDAAPAPAPQQPAPQPAPAPGPRQTGQTTQPAPPPAPAPQQPAPAGAPAQQPQTPAPAAPEPETTGQAPAGQPDMAKVESNWTSGKILPPGAVTDPAALEASRNPGAIAHLSPAEQEVIKKIANYTADPNKLFVGKQAPLRAEAMRLASNYDPSYSPQQMAARQRIINGYGATGVDARNLQSHDMAIQHLGRAMDNVEKLQNSGFPFVNVLRGQIADNTPAFAQLRIARQEMQQDIKAIGSELMRAFRGSGHASEREALRWEQTMSLTTQPDRFRAGLREAANLLEGRVRAAGDAYNRSMGPGYQRPADSWVSPESRETFQRALMIDPTKPIPPSSQEQARQQQRGGGPQPGSAQPQRGTPPVQVGTPEDARKLSPGTRFIIPSGPSKGMIGTAP